LTTPTTTIMKLSALRPTLARFALLLCAAALLAGAPEVEAKRLGGGGGAGMQRQMPAKPANSATPAQPAQNQAAAPATPAAPAGTPPKRSWMGPLAGLAAGLGIAALLSHFGMGEAVANFMMMALLAGAAVFLVVWLLRRFGPKPAQPAMGYAGAGAGHGTSGSDHSSPWAQRQADVPPTPVQQPLATPAWGQQPAGTALVEPAAAATTATAAAAAAPLTLPPGFDRAGFERIAKMLFIRLQAANDAGQVDDLRKFTTPELFAHLRLDVQDRGQNPQQTDVQRVDAEVVDSAQADGQWLVSVRFHGLIREEANATAEPFDELWHLVRPLDESRDWAIAGIQQSSTPAAPNAPTVH
jgi:predicted lipid-binding transport protein (Tim44 family)